jgi:hypothetical protein
MSLYLTNDQFCSEMRPILKNLYNDVGMYWDAIKIVSTQLPPNPYITLYILTVELRPCQWHIDPKYVDMFLKKYYEITPAYFSMGGILPNQPIIITLDLSGDWKTFACQEIIKYMPIEK